MECRICGSRNIDITYKGPIRNGGLGNYTDKPVTMYKCQGCDVIWHDKMIDIDRYYETDEYRVSLEDTSNPADFYKLHDKESKWKFDITGTDIFRGKTVMDIGCGMGAYLDYVMGLAKRVVAIEPSQIYQDKMKEKGFITYSYARDAIEDGLKNKIDVIVSFDVIEHVDDPCQFITEAYDLLSEGGCALIGTPTDAPIMRGLLKENFEKKQLFSVQHLWVFGEKNLEIMSKKAGCYNRKTVYYQRYGFGNFVGWLIEKRPKSEIDKEWISNSLDAMWKGHLEENKLADYIVLEMRK